MPILIDDSKWQAIILAFVNAKNSAELERLWRDDLAEDTEMTNARPD